jgi:peptide/nickel transport system substrate-binding protein
LRYRIVFGVIVAAAVAALLSACGGGSSNSGGGSSNGGSSASSSQTGTTIAQTGTPTKGGMLTFAEQPGSTPTYIFPLYNGANSGNDNITYLQPLMWKPLYWFGHPDSSAATLDPQLSMADMPVYSDGDKTITIKLKHYMWSDGKPVTARDVTFWMHLLLAEKSNYAGYVPGGFLDHVTSVSAPNATTFVMHLDQAYNKTYLLYNGLALISPIPQASWDKESASGKVGDYDDTPAGAKKVYAYLNKASLSLSTWDTNPIWQVVDGPWHLKPKTGFQTTGQTIMEANPQYSGPDKPHLSEFEELPFTSSAAEFNALQAGTVDYGYVPTTDIAAANTLKNSGDTIDPWYEWGLTFIGINFSNPKYAPLLSQLYIRQAMESLINQPEYVQDVLKNYGTPTYGPVPTFPKTSFLNPAAEKNPYPYSVSAARKLLTSHGWSIPSSGAATCTKPGSGAGQCGAGIASGAKLQVPLLFSTGFPAVQDEVQATQSAFRSAGIDLSLQESPINTVLSEGYECAGKTTAQCPASSTALSIIASPVYTYVPIYYPDGDSLFACHGATNGGNYCNAQVDAGIKKIITSTSSSNAPLYKYQLLVAKQLPVLWFPNSAYQISAISSKVGGVVAQDSTAHIYPQNWYVKH